MNRISGTTMCVGLLAALFFVTGVSESYAKPSASLKFTTNREENLKDGKETLVLPYAFPSESMGTTLGVGALAKGYGQDQLLVAASAWGSADDAVGVVLGLWDYKLPATNRFFFSILGSAGDYPRQRAYSIPGLKGQDGSPGSNDSDKDDYLETSGVDNWWEMKVEYVLPIGGMKNDGMANYKLKRGMLVSGAAGGKEWNPLTSGATVVVLKNFNRYQEFETDEGDLDGTMHPLELGLLYNNTDFYTNPSEGSSQYLSITHDFGWMESPETWTFLEFEGSKYFSLGANDLARQQVVALNLWTGSSPSWETTTNADGREEVSHDPPYLAGARLGGFYRFRAYPTNRFNDRSVIYTTAEYRFTPEWNPIGETSWLRWLKMDWMQLVGFVEGGRVADEYSDLFSDWKGDIGFGFRAMLAGGVVRFDYAVSDEGSAGWVMFGQPF
ncbi:MAG: hypothetical protein ACI8PB_002274 [Desulforhopalus sp.]|jgi:hypothetical protein